MKKVTQVLVAILLSVSVVGTGSVANAQSNEDENTCDSIVITNTGEGSYNEGICTVNVDVNVTCNGTYYILNDNDQEAATGAASEIGNTTGDTAISGNATNENGDTVAIGSKCGETTTTTTPTTPETPTTPSTPAAPATPAPQQKVAALPYTASNSVMTIVTIAAVTVAAALVASRAMISAYRRSTLK